VARELLTDSGSIFVQIGDENVHLIRCMLDEVFGTDNFVSQITFAKTSGSTGDFLPGTSDFLLFYARNRENLKYRQPYAAKELGPVAEGPYNMLELMDGTRRRMTREERENTSRIPKGARIFRLDNLQSQSIGRAKGEGAASWFPVSFRAQQFTPSSKSRWKTNEEGMNRLKAANRLEATRTGLYYVRYIDDFPARPVGDRWDDTVVAGFASDKRYVVETSSKVIQRCLLMTTDAGDLVLDPTCGSATTAFVAEQWGRRWITIDTSRVAITLARTRLMAGRYPYYLLADSPEGIEKESEITGVAGQSRETGNDVRKGFVCRRVPHIMLRTIAQNEDISAEVTRDEIEKAILRNAASEQLYDQPYEDKKRVRVTGPFTVESLSPHRTISVAEKKARRESFGDGRSLKVFGPDKFGLMIIENLRKAGVQNTKKNERLKFDSIEPYAGEWIHAEGRYTEALSPQPSPQSGEREESPHPSPLPEGEGVERRAAICIGPEHGTVGPELVKEAAKEAVRGVGFDILIVCGFAFDPHVAEEATRYGKLVVLPCRMNPDLAMGDELLKKTGAGNLFMVFGEPDLEVTTTDDGQLVVEIRGVDVYDPTTGEIRSSSTDDIACWFIDTNYNGESFFVRHAYFTGADEPYEKLKRALRADIDEDAWSQLYSTTSRPFSKPETGKIAVKVINHYGDEVLKVYSV
jgi:adenine-specific DNA-methyltransferase